MAKGDTIVKIPMKVDYVNCAINPEYSLVLRMTAKKNGTAEVSAFFQNNEMKIETDEKLSPHLISINPCPPVLGKRYDLGKVGTVTVEEMSNCDISAVITLDPTHDRLRVTIIHKLGGRYIMEALIFVPEHKRQKYRQTMIHTRRFGYEFIASKMPEDFFSENQAVAACD